MLNIDGLITGIDTETIIDGLLDIQQSQIDRLQLRKNEVRARQAAYDSLESQLVSLQTIADRLARTQASVFHERSVNVSHEQAVIASASTTAAQGTYSITVDALARAHQVVSGGFSGLDAEIHQGVFELSTGTSPPVSITIDASNNTLAGLAAEINAAEAGVSAAIVQDGSTGGAAFRLLLTSQQTGLAHAMVVNNQLTMSSGTSQPVAFDFAQPVQAAADAQVRLGSGAGALTVQSADNTVDSLIHGVTIELLQADPAEELTLQVTGETESARTAITDFVDSYNAIMEFIDELIRYDVESDSAGLLIGDRTVTDLQHELRAAMLDVVDGLSPDTLANRLAVLGVRVNNAGRLTINQTQLEDALAGRIEGITEDDLQAFFGDVKNNGLAVRVGQLVRDVIDLESGELTAARDGLSAQLLSLDDSIERAEAVFAAQQTSLLAQFAALEGALSELQSTSSFLVGQLSGLGIQRTGRG